MAKQRDIEQELLEDLEAVKAHKSEAAQLRRRAPLPRYRRRRRFAAASSFRSTLLRV